MNHVPTVTRPLARRTRAQRHPRRTSLRVIIATGIARLD